MGRSSSTSSSCSSRRCLSSRHWRAARSAACSCWPCCRFWRVTSSRFDPRLAPRLLAARVPLVGNRPPAFRRVGSTGASGDSKPSWHACTGRRADAGSARYALATADGVSVVSRQSIHRSAVCVRYHEERTGTSSFAHDIARRTRIIECVKRPACGRATGSMTCSWGAIDSSLVRTHLRAPTPPA